MWKTLNASQFFNVNPNAPEAEMRRLWRKFLECQVVAVLNAFFSTDYMSCSFAASSKELKEVVDRFFTDHFRQDTYMGENDADALQNIAFFDLPCSAIGPTIIEQRPKRLRGRENPASRSGSRCRV